MLPAIVGGGGGRDHRMQPDIGNKRNDIMKIEKSLVEALAMIPCTSTPLLSM